MVLLYLDVQAPISFPEHRSGVDVFFGRPCCCFYKLQESEGGPVDQVSEQWINRKSDWACLFFCPKMNSLVRAQVEHVCRTRRRVQILRNVRQHIV